LAKQWRLPLVRQNLRRVRLTEPQVNLAAGERELNVRGAFAVSNRNAVAGKRIILVDDVFTTGSTVAECARTLNRAGAEAVFIVTVARAV
jgi:predicted amidophosphoribosyltransferase